jgi:hypothetical protein
MPSVEASLPANTDFAAPAAPVTPVEEVPAEGTDSADDE